MLEAYDEAQRDSWEQTRALAHVVAQFSGNMKNPNQSVQKFWPLPWDKAGAKSNAKDILEYQAFKEARRRALEQQNNN